MDLIPKQNSLLSQATALLRKAIKAGEWKTHLPGERKLCERMQIGRDTLRLALAQLERERLVTKSEPGKRRRVRRSKQGKSADAERASARLRQVIFLAPARLEHLTSSVILEIDAVREHLMESGYRLEIVTSPAFHQKHPQKVLEKLVEEHRSSVWVLHQTTLAIQRWFYQQGLPCIVHGTPQPEIHLPFLDNDYISMGRHAAGFLLGRGHEHIAFLRPKSELRGLEALETGIAEAIAKHPAQVAKPRRLVENGTTENVVERFEQMLTCRPRPTALLVSRARHALTIVSWLARKKLCLKKDISLICLDHQRFLDHMIPAIACYKSDPQKLSTVLLKKILAVASAGRTARNSQLIMPEFVQGDSVARIKV